MPDRKKLTAIVTEYFAGSHADVIVTKFLKGFPADTGFQAPRVAVASIYIDQVSAQDIGVGLAAEHGVPIFTSIFEALTLGEDSLAVDGVLLIGEHGEYAWNEKEQQLFPRKYFLEQICGVMATSGTPVPVFNDKHLSTSWKECAEMVADSKRLGFPFFAGSSLPVTRRLPAIDLPHGTPLKESVCVAYGGVDSYDIHALETAQCMSERRKGGEVGIESVLALRDEAMWKHLAEPGRRDTRRLMISALTRSHNLPVETGYYSDRITFKWARAKFPSAVGYFIKHLDGFRTTMFLVGIQDFNYAGLRADNDEIISTQMYLPMPSHGSTTADFFHPLTRHIEDTVITGRVPYPVERTLLTSGMVIAGVESLHRGGVLVKTPEMKVRYTVGKESTYWQD